MSPAIASSASAQRLRVPHRATERAFFAVMILLLWGTVLFGFSKTYFMAGMVRAPLPNRLIHVHGAAFSLWMILLLVQTVLIVTKNVKVHRALGVYGFGLAVAMVGLGVFAAVDALRRHSGPLGLEPRIFFIIPISSILSFAVLVFAAYRWRNRPEYHKRLILIATVSIMDAAVGRWPIALLQTHPPLQDLVPLAFLLAIVAFDLVQLGRVSRATLWASLGLIVVHLTRVPLGSTHAWVAMADRLMQS